MHQRISFARTFISVRTMLKIRDRLKNSTHDLATAPRYRYFIQIDEKFLQSLLRDTESGPRLKGLQSNGYVNFVDGWWKSLREQYSTSQDPDLKEEIDEQLAHGYQSIEGCMEENTGWTMLHRLDMSVDF
jgi:hypothetical protein